MNKYKLKITPKAKKYLIVAYTIMSPFIGLMAAYIISLAAGVFFTSDFYLDRVNVDRVDEIGLFVYAFMPALLVAIVSYVAFNLMQIIMFSFQVRNRRLILSFIGVHLIAILVFIGTILILGE